jgi:heat shock transcription factor
MPSSLQPLMSPASSFRAECLGAGGGAATLATLAAEAKDTNAVATTTQHDVEPVPRRRKKRKAAAASEPDPVKDGLVAVDATEDEHEQEEEEEEEQGNLSEQAASPFLRTLWRMLSDSTVSEYIHWNEAGNAVVIPDSVAFAHHAVSRYFRHQRFDSFVRQMNLYGFRRSKTKDRMFVHSVFHRDRPDQWQSIRRNTHHKTPTQLCALASKVDSLQREVACLRKQVRELLLARTAASASPV